MYVLYNKYKFNDGTFDFNLLIPLFPCNSFWRNTLYSPYQKSCEWEESPLWSLGCETALRESCIHDLSLNLEKDIFIYPCL